MSWLLLALGIVLATVPIPAWRTSTRVLGRAGRPLHAVADTVVVALCLGFAVLSVAAGIVFVLPVGRKRLLGPVERIARTARKGVVDAIQPRR